MTTEHQRSSNSRSPTSCKPADGRFGCGPSKVRPRGARAARRRRRGADGHLAPPEAGQGARRRDPRRAARAVRAARRLRGRARQRRRDRVLGRRRVRPGRASARCTSSTASSRRSSPTVTTRRAVPRATRSSSPPSPAARPTRRRRPRPRRRGRDRVGAQRDLDRRDGRRCAGRPAPATRWSRSTPPRAPAGCRSTSPQADAYYFAPQKSFASDGGLWLALLSPAAQERIAELARLRALDPRRSCRCTTALENSLKDQTYNTPAVATLFLLADQIDWMLDGGGLDWCVARTRASSEHLYGWAERAALRDAVRRRSRAALAGRRHDRLRRLRRRRRASRRRCAPTASSTSSPTASSGATSCASAMFPAVEPADVQALTACIDWVVERLGMSALGDRAAARAGAGQGEDRRLGRRAAARALRRRARASTGATRSWPSGSASYDGIVIRSATKLTAELIERGERLRVIGRAGVGVDNVDVAGRHQARDRRRQRARVERRHRRRAHDGAAARARAQHPAGATPR